MLIDSGGEQREGVFEGRERFENYVRQFLTDRPQLEGKFGLIVLATRWAKTAASAQAVDLYQGPCMNKQIRTVLRNACRAAPAALALGIVTQTTLAETGDLDPGFADVGRLVLPDFLGPAFTVEAQDDNIILAGGKLVPQFGENREAFGFARRLSGTAALDATFAAAGLDDLMVVDLEVQRDGTMVGVGRRTSERDAVSVAFRLQRDGALDAGFGQDGVVELTGITDVRSAAVDPGGAVVIAASSTPGDMPRAALIVLTPFHRQPGRFIWNRRVFFYLRRRRDVLYPVAHPERGERRLPYRGKCGYHWFPWMPCTGVDGKRYPGLGCSDRCRRRMQFDG